MYLTAILGRFLQRPNGKIKPLLPTQKKRMEEVRNRLRKKAREEERQQIIEDVFADNSDNADNSEPAVVSSLADDILDD